MPGAAAHICVGAGGVERCYGFTLAGWCQTDETTIGTDTEVLLMVFGCGREGEEKAEDL